VKTDEFKVHRLNETGMGKAEAIAAAFALLVDTLDAVGIGTARERALVITKLQEASFFAKRGMAIDPANQVPTP
jgi:DNA topoisomerase IA